MKEEEKEVKRIILRYLTPIKCERCKKETRAYIKLRTGKKICLSCWKRDASRNKKNYPKGICEECGKLRRIGWRNPEKKKICYTCYLKAKGEYKRKECPICGKERILLNRDPITQEPCCSTCYKKRKKRGAISHGKKKNYIE